ncbi:hypothetical protein [Stappia sp. 28M-7]|uniref:hypothetical protein n=1 Tax=Stappia sp. 28M-7 TaxID=2762596 RepID=UPI00163C89CA|nr:hypothetical protein [Stappia sp. 28M-7]MBC2858726.1 hypothetical protein [Stappia sp. 28M-7]
MAETPILDLETLIKRPIIRIDGERYELRAPDELSVLESQRLTTAGKEIEALASSGDPENVLAGVIDDVTRRIVVDLPDAVLAGLSESQKMAICEVFTQLLMRRRLAVAGAIARKLTGATAQSARTGDLSSQGSNASTAAPPTTGSHARPAGS